MRFFYWGGAFLSTLVLIDWALHEPVADFNQPAKKSAVFLGTAVDQKAEGSTFQLKSADEIGLSAKASSYERRRLYAHSEAISKNANEDSESDPNLKTALNQFPQQNPENTYDFEGAFEDRIDEDFVSDILSRSSFSNSSSESRIGEVMAERGGISVEDPPEEGVPSDTLTGASAPVLPEENRQGSKRTTDKISKKNIWEIVAFKEGFLNDRKRRIRHQHNPYFALRGPDFSLSQIDPSQSFALQEMKKRLWSFGHGGEMILKLASGHQIKNKPGDDFAVFENVTQFGDMYFQEFAKVGLSMSKDPASAKWFSCEPAKKVLSGCAGVVPTSKGGDRFDMELLGLKRAKYLFIRDWGENTGSLKENTEGFDLDAVELL